MPNYKEILVSMICIVFISVTVDKINTADLDGKCVTCRSIKITCIIYDYDRCTIPCQIKNTNLHVMKSPCISKDVYIVKSGQYCAFIFCQAELYSYALLNAGLGPTL